MGCRVYPYLASYFSQKDPGHVETLKPLCDSICPPAPARHKERPYKISTLLKPPLFLQQVDVFSVINQLLGWPLGYLKLFPNWFHEDPKYLTLRVQVPNNHILPPNLYYNYYYPNPKYLIIGYMDPLGNIFQRAPKGQPRAV